MLTRERIIDKPVQITFRNLDRSESVVALIEEKCRKLERFYSHIIGVDVKVEGPSPGSRRDIHYHVTIDLSVPGKHLVASHVPDKHNRHDQLMPAINDAFHAVTKQLEEYAREQRGEVKRHEGRQKSVA